MNPSLPSRKAGCSLRSRGAICTVSALAAIQFLGGVTGCKSVDSGVTGTDPTPVVADSAIIRVTNSISQDPDSLTLLLFSASAVDWTSSNYIKRLGGVSLGGTADIKVPVGTWKLAYEKSGGILVPMQDIDAGAEEWLKAIFEKNGRYSLILITDVRETVWVPSFKTDPEIE